MNGELSRNTRHILWAIQYLRKGNALPNAQEVVHAFTSAGKDIPFMQAYNTILLVEAAIQKPNRAREVLPRGWTAALTNSFIETIQNIVRERPVPRPNVDFLVKMMESTSEKQPPKNKPDWEAKVNEIIANPFQKGTRISDALTWIRAYFLPNEKHSGHVETIDEKKFQERMENDPAFKEAVKFAFVSRTRFNRMQELRRRGVSTILGNTHTNEFSHDTETRQWVFGRERERLSRVRSISKRIIEQYRKRAGRAR